MPVWLRVALLAVLSLAFATAQAASAEDLLSSIKLAEERPSSWPAPPIERYQLQTEDKNVSVAQILSIIAERDRQYEQRFNAQEKAVINALAAAKEAVTAALAAAKEAVLKAEAAANLRFESVNEQRAQLRDQAATFMTKGESGAKFADVDRRLVALETVMAEHAGSSKGMSELWLVILGISGFLVAAGVLIMRFREKATT